MYRQYYRDALKMGKREYRSCIARKIDPRLPVLADMLPDDLPTQGINLGIIQVPTEMIVGTRYQGRSNVFSRSFLPLLPENSEFSDKWVRLCQSHLEEGIREPIKVWEYMHRFYVEEGNKRVSVLRFFNAVSIPSTVMRILPRRDGSQEVEMYYEFIEFHRLSGIYDIEFSRPGSYAQLIKLTGKDPGHKWSDDERSTFAFAYYYFRLAYEKCGGQRLNSTVGDALLAYLKVYSYQTLQEKNVQEITKQLANIWEEVALQQEVTPIDVRLKPEEKKPSLLEKVFVSTEARDTSIAFIHDRNPDVSGWTRGHEQGRKYIEETMGNSITTHAYFNAMDDDPHAVIEQAIEDGNSILFTTSPRLLPASLRAAVEHPEITILNCSLNTRHRYIRTYYARMYEAKFVIGAIAGALSMSDNVGYLCDYPIFGQIAGINAFALGAQMVNPRARVVLEWSAVDGVDAAVKRLADRGVRIVSSQDLTRQDAEERSAYGLNLFADGRQIDLVKPVWNWGVYYESLIRRIWDRSLQSEYEESNRAQNYYWGMSAGVVDLICSDRVPLSTRRMAELLKNAIRSGACEPFVGPIYTQQGQEVIGDGKRLTIEQIVGMDWLIENVDGEIPSYNDLNEIGKATVDMVGVKPSTQERQN